MSRRHENSDDIPGCCKYGYINQQRGYRFALSVCMLATALVSTQAVAQDDSTIFLTQGPPALPQAPRAPTVESMNDSQTSTNGRTASSSYQPPRLGASIELELQQREGLDEEDLLRRDTTRADIELTLDIEQALGSYASFAARLELSTRRHSDDQLDRDEEIEGYDLERFFYELSPNKALRLRLGRQALDDTMKSIVDEDLDGVQIRYEAGRAELELSYTREDWFEASSEPRQDNINNIMGSAKFEPGKDIQWTPYVLHRAEQSFNGSEPSEATWFGLQALVEPKRSNWRYWLHGMALDGELDNDTQRVTLGGFAVDAGLNYTLAGWLDSTFTLALTHASGGSRAKRFRQSGLHSNEFELNDKNEFQYLGEVLDPEMTNIQILTIGWGAEPFKKWRTDVALHAYQQVETDNDLRGTNIEYQPTGLDKQLGTGADLIIAYEPAKALQILGIAGRFIPGDAFDGDRDDAWLARVEIEYNF